MKTYTPYERFIRAMMLPSIYPHKVADVSLIETHISSVLLAGDFAYKIKKPVNLGFVDFSTLAKRKIYCDEEIRLNRRLAEQLYIGVVPIYGLPEAPSLTASGPIIEYAVKMHRFSQEDLLNKRADKGQISEAIIDQLAKQVAHFHLQAQSLPIESEAGGAKSMHHWFSENFDQITPFLTEDAQKTEVLSLKQWGEQQYHRHHDDLTQRKQKGFIRECHGDLHLGNIVVLDSQPVCFDCIEFNDDFRWIDVLKEVAFLLMDLDRRGYASLASAFLNGYLAKTGDYEGLPLLSYYRVYLALVRAKVSLLKQSPPDFSEFNHYIKCALHYTKLCKPSLIITHGFSGAGKSYWSKGIAMEIGAVHIRSDLERKRVFGLQSNEQSTKSPTLRGIYTKDATQITYAKLADIARLVIQAGFSVIVDATFISATHRSEFKSLAKTLNADFLILAFTADEATLRTRLQQRQRKQDDPSDADENVLNHQLQHNEPLSAQEMTSTWLIDNDPETELEDIVAKIKTTLRI